MYLLDTSVLSELIKQRPNAGLLTQLREKQPDTLFTAAICVMELRYGALLRIDHAVFWQRLQKEILSHVQVLAFGSQEALAAADILAHLKRIGRPVGLEGVLIGSIARTHGYTVVTHNVRHFQHIPGVKVEDWLAAI